MMIRVPPWAVAHFWDEPPPGSEEFWAFRNVPAVRVGERIEFEIAGRLVADAIVSRVERPGESRCGRTGGWAGRWKVFWSPESFRDLRRVTQPGRACGGPDWWGPRG